MTGKYLNEKNEAAITSNIIKENCPRGIEQSSIGCTVKKLLVWRSPLQNPVVLLTNTIKKKKNNNN